MEVHFTHALFNAVYYCNIFMLFLDILFTDYRTTTSTSDAITWDTTNEQKKEA